jgi:ribosomal protein S18 acetylase RimI-like enzyme
MSTTAKTYPWAAQFGGRSVTFRCMRAEDQELFKSFIRSLPHVDNFYLLVDVHNDQDIARWMQRMESGQTVSVIALDNERMIGYGNLHANEPPWISHVGEIRMCVAGAHRGRGLGRTLAKEVFAMARARGLEKIWARMASSQDSAQKVFHRLGFHTEARLSGFVKNQDGLTEDLVIMSYDAGELWEL